MASVTTRVMRNARRKGVKVIGRVGWGCPNPVVYTWRRRYRRHARIKSDTLWQHITVTRRRGIRRDMRTLHSIGMQRFGSGVSYNFAIDMVTGQVGLGQSLDARGTHTVNNKNIPGFSYNQNKVAHAFAFIGMPGDKPSQAAINAAGKLMAAMIEEGALTLGHDYVPHSLVAYKECPTDEVRSVMLKIRNIGVGAVKR